MGKVPNHGWRKSIKDAAQPTGIVYGRNLKKNDKESAKRSTSYKASNPPPKSVVPDDIQ
jgi:hypothetical protein